MALGLTSEHLELAAAVRGWAQRHSPAEAVRAAADGADGGAELYHGVFAPGLAEQGLFGLHLPEADGGQGYGLPELAVAVEELGRALLPGAFLPTVLASAVLAESAQAAQAESAQAESAQAEVGQAGVGQAEVGQAEVGQAGVGQAEVRQAEVGQAEVGQAESGRSGDGRSGDGPIMTGSIGKLLASLADGSKTGAVSLAEGLTGTPAADGGLVVTGESGPVLAGSMADVVIAGVRGDRGMAWVAIDSADLQVTAVDSLDLTRPLARMRADGVVVAADRILSGIDRTGVASLAAIVFGAEACGIADWAVHTATEYAKIRRQFGRPIGQFQAVKHRCARMLTEAEQAAAAVWDAARTEPGRGREFAASVAAAVAIDAAVDAVNACIQTLGGIGYTWEHDAHLYYRRAMSVRALLGPATGWREQVATLALAGASQPVRMELPEGDAEFRAQIGAELAGIGRLTGQDLAHRLATGGWVAPHLPRPWGRDASPLEQLVIDSEMRSAGIRAPNLAIGAWVVPALIKYGTPEQQERFLLPTLRADYVWCQLFSEPGAGSDLAGLTTRAERVAGGWRIDGQKIWTSLAREASWAICIARTDPSAPRHDGISYFLVDMHSAGIEVRPLREITGDAIFNQVFLDSVFVPDDCLVGEVNGGWPIARTTLANERVSLSQSWTFGSGVPELLDVARAASHAPLAEVGRLVCEGRAIDLLGLRVTLKRLSGTEPGATGSVRKLLGMRIAQQISEICWAMSGDSGALAAGFGPSVGQDGQPNGGQWARQVLLTRALTIGGGTTDIQLNIIGERILGLPRDPDPPAT
jgi:alkylation response protein AidB-like acyl-CoA dehydrogenase